MNLMEPRTGGFMLCSCGHCKTFHYRKPKWYKGPLSDNEPCGHCGCQGYEQGDFQGYRFVQDPHAWRDEP